MLTGRDMSASLRNRGRYLDEDRNMADSASMCFDAAAEIDRLLDVIRTRDKHIKELQAEIFVSDGSDITKLDALKAEVLTIIEPFAEMGEGLSYDKDGVWRRRHHGRVDNLGRNVEIIFTEGEDFERIASLKARLTGDSRSDESQAAPDPDKAQS